MQVGAHPPRFTDTLGGQVLVAIREGSRARYKSERSISGILAMLTAKGPLGSTSQGSWLISARQSSLNWPTTNFGSEYGGVGFGFRDVLTKVVYDVNAEHQLSMTAVAGDSLGDVSDVAATNGFFEGRHRASFITVAGSTPSGRHASDGR